MRAQSLTIAVAAMVAAIVAAACTEDLPIAVEDIGSPHFARTDGLAELGSPLDKATAEQLAMFEEGLEITETFFHETELDIPQIPGLRTRPGVGPLFNAPTCESCHFSPKAGGGTAASPPAPPIFFQRSHERHGALFVGGDDYAGATCDHLEEYGGPVWHNEARFVFRELLVTLGLRPDPDGDGLASIPPFPSGLEQPPAFVVGNPNFNIALRNSPDLFGFGLLDAIPDETILALADPYDLDGDGISGRPHITDDGHLGRFGRKAEEPELDEFNINALANEQGVTSPFKPEENNCFEGNCDIVRLPPPDGGNVTLGDELSAEEVEAVLMFFKLLAPPLRDGTVPNNEIRNGEQIFREIGCADCHVPRLHTAEDHPIRALRDRPIEAYTDFLLHDMGRNQGELGFEDTCFFNALPWEFRTEPLMGLRFVNFMLHDGRANHPDLETRIVQAIDWHGGEATAARDNFNNLSARDRSRILAFLRSL